MESNNSQIVHPPVTRKEVRVMETNRGDHLCWQISEGGEKTRHHFWWCRARKRKTDSIRNRLSTKGNQSKISAGAEKESRWEISFDFSFRKLSSGGRICPIPTRDGVFMDFATISRGSPSYYFARWRQQREAKEAKDLSHRSDLIQIGEDRWHDSEEGGLFFWHQVTWRHQCMSWQEIWLRSATRLLLFLRLQSSLFPPPSRD